MMEACSTAAPPSGQLNMVKGIVNVPRGACLPKSINIGFFLYSTSCTKILHKSVSHLAFSALVFSLSLHPFLYLSESELFHFTSCNMKAPLHCILSSACPKEDSHIKNSKLRPTNCAFKMKDNFNS